MEVVIARHILQETGLAPVRSCKSPIAMNDSELPAQDESLREEQRAADGPWPAQLFRRAAEPSHKEQLLWAIGAFAITTMSFLTMLLTAPEARLPARPGDGPDYDNIAVNLKNGRGFGLDPQDEEFLKPYIDHNTDGRYNYLLERQTEPHPTTLRPPAFPFLLSAIYQFVGRDFLVVRVCQVFSAAGAVALAVMLAARIGGAVLAMPTLLLAIVDSCVRADSTFYRYAMDVVTEPLAQLLLLLLVLSLLALQQRRAVISAVVAGVVFGMLILARSVFSLWSPFILLYLLLSLGLQKRTIVLLGSFMLGVLIVGSPWWIRNSLVLQSPMPLGTHGWTSLLGGYSDEAYRDRGNWSMDHSNRLATELNQQTRFREIDDPVIRDREFALASRDRTIQWIKENPGKVAKLIPMRLLTHWFPYPGKIVVLSSLALLGLLAAMIFLRAHPATKLFTMLLLADAIVTMCTYTVGGRFLVPLYPCLYILAAISIVAGPLWLMSNARRASGRLTARQREARHNE